MNSTDEGWQACCVPELKAWIANQTRELRAVIHYHIRLLLDHHLLAEPIANEPGKYKFRIPRGELPRCEQVRWPTGIRFIFVVSHRQLTVLFIDAGDHETSIVYGKVSVYEDERK